MIEIEKPTIVSECSEDDPCYGKFVVEPLERGYGNTLGNSGSPTTPTKSSSAPAGVYGKATIDGAVFGDAGHLDEGSAEVDADGVTGCGHGWVLSGGVAVVGRECTLSAGHAQCPMGA